MGASEPKLDLGDLHAEMEEAVSDAVITQHTDDDILDGLIELAIICIREGRSLTTNPLDEPALWKRHFLDWVELALDEAAKAQDIIDKEKEKIAKGLLK